MLIVARSTAGLYNSCAPEPNFWRFWPPNRQKVVYERDPLLVGTQRRRRHRPEAGIGGGDIVDGHLTQIARRNPALNAIVTLDADGARRRAREADAALAHGEIWGSLQGLG